MNLRKNCRERSIFMLTATESSVHAIRTSKNSSLQNKVEKSRLTARCVQGFVPRISDSFQLTAVGEIATDAATKEWYTKTSSCVCLSERMANITLCEDKLIKVFPRIMAVQFLKKLKERLPGLLIAIYEEEHLIPQNASPWSSRCESRWTWKLR